MNLKHRLSNINIKLIRYFTLPVRSQSLPDPVDLLIATILSQNTNDQNSYKAFKNLKSDFKDWNELAKSSKKKIIKSIKIAGLGKQKSETIKNFLSKQLLVNGGINLNHFKYETDTSIINELTSYKGIGIKTASCVLLFSLGRNVCPVDTHVHRVLNRLGIVKTKSPDKTFLEIKDSLPKDAAHSLHTNLIRLGREICKPKKPKCFICPLNKICQFPDKNLLPVSNSMGNTDFMLLDNV